MSSYCTFQVSALVMNKAAGEEQKQTNGKTIKAYAKHILRMGGSEERKEVLSLIKTEIGLKDASLEILL